jgi:hypothetical protein
MLGNEPRGKFMANTIKAANGFYAECDEYDSPIYTYWDLPIDRVKQITVSSDKMVTFMQDNSIMEWEGRNLKNKHFCYPFHPDYFQNIQLSGNTIIMQSTNDETYKCDFGTNGNYWERVWN